MSSRMEFYGPAILDALVKAGGGEYVENVYAHVLKRLSGRMPPGDFEFTDSGFGEPNWKNNTRWARAAMVRAGLIHKPRRRGFWEITAAGRKWLAERFHRI
jgi:restriction endonuclease Mrr